MKRIIFLHTLLIHFTFGQTQPVGDNIDQYLDSVTNAYKIPGIAAGIAVDGKIFWTGSSGYADIENSTKASPQTIFRTGSITKVLTATAAMRLVEDGKLDPEATVQTYLPDYPVSKKGEIRIKHLLYHTSGIRHYKGNENRSFTHYDNLRKASEIFQDRSLKFEPGLDYQYTSYGYTLLGAVIENVTGESYYDALKSLVLDPAGMESTFVEDRSQINENQAKLYTKKGKDILPDVDNDLSNIYPAGGLVSTVEDLLKFVIAWESAQLVTENSMKQMLEPPKSGSKVLAENAGIGWNIWKHNKYGQVYHRVGGQSGTSALLISYRDAGVSVILLSNQAVLDPIWEITNELIGYGLRSKQN